MATVREKLLPVVAKLRALNDARLGLRRYTVYVRRETPSDGRGGLGATAVRVDTELPERPRIRQATQRDVVAGGGRISIADFIMDLVTPENDAGTVGTPVSTLDLSPDPATPGQKVMLVLDGPEMPTYVAGPPPGGGGEFEITTSDCTRNFGWRFVLSPRTGRR